MNQEELAEIRSTLEFAATNGADEEFLDTAYNLLAHIDSQAAQIEALKALLLDDRCKCIMLVEKLKSVANDPKWMEKGLEKTLDEYMQEARQQLKAEMKGFGD